MSVEHTDPYASGDRIRVRVRVRAGTYLTVLRVDTQGRIHILYPFTPTHTGATSSPGALAAPFSFPAEQTPGVGYILAFASTGPLDFRSLSRTGRWHFPTDWRYVSGDPLESAIRRVAALSSSFWYDREAYRVGGPYEFPRFACNGCHAPIPGWDPYGGRCSLITLEQILAPADYVYRIAGPRSAVARASRALPRLVYRIPQRESAPMGPTGQDRVLNPWDGGGLAPPAWIRSRPESTGKPALRRRVPRGAPPGVSRPSRETREGPGSYR